MASADTVRAIVATAPGVYGPSRIRLRPPGEREVLVRLDAAAMCITDTLSLDGLGLSPFPYVPGHSAVGTVDAVGRDVERLAVGDRVAVTGTAQCGHCYYCTHGSPSACEDVLGGMVRVIGEDLDGAPVYADGGISTMADAMVYRESNVVRIEPGTVPAEHLAMLGCGIASGLGAVLEVAGTQPGASVVVLGCGHLGLWMVQAARLAGASPIIAVDPLAERRSLAMTLGATCVLDGQDVAEAVRNATDGRGADVGLEAAGSTRAMEQAFAATRSGGVVVPTGMESPTASVTLNGYEFALHAKQIRSSQTGGGDVVRTIPTYCGYLADGSIDARPYVSATYPLEGFADAVAATRGRVGITGVVLLGERAA